MTPPDDLPPDDGLDPDELAVHAVLDDEADAEQRRRVARDPALVARVNALRGAADAVAAPVSPPADDTFAALRARALDVGGADGVDHTAVASDEPSPDGAEPSDRDEVTALAPGPPPDLAVRRARRRRRRLPPLPAVAAVVLLLVLFGSMLILTDRGGSDADQGTAADVADEAGGDSEAAADSPAAEDEAFGAEEELATLGAEATAAYTDEAELLDALRTVDPDTLDLSGTGSPVPSPTTAAGAGEEGDDGDDASVSGDVPESTTTSRAEQLSLTDPRVTRCDTVLRSTAPNIGPAQAATIVLVDDLPVLVLSNPVSATAEEEASIRLSTFDAVSCVPGDAVQR